MQKKTLRKTTQTLHYSTKKKYSTAKLYTFTTHFNLSLVNLCTTERYGYTKTLIVEMIWHANPIQLH